MTDLTIGADHHRYLAIQQGGISHLKDDREAFRTAYNLALESTYQSFRPYLPRQCFRLLDIGCGLAGIDVVLSRHYGEGAPELLLVDGENDAPLVPRHNVTFNSRGVTLDFLRANGITAPIDYRTPQTLGMAKPCDLIVSFASFAFHYPPDLYLDWITACCHRETMLIFDVRRERPEWRGQLERFFKPLGSVYDRVKAQRIIYGYR
jgi:SAM-dependent methyltransferase